MAKVLNGLEIKADNTDLALGEFASAKKRALWRIGAQAEGHAKEICPVRTGRLRNSITHTEDGEAAYIGTNVEYAPQVELGTARRKPKPFLRPAATGHTSEYKAILRDELQG